MLFGSFERKLDSKGRLKIPSSFNFKETTSLFLIHGFEGCISIYTIEEFNKFIEPLKTKSYLNKKNRDLLRIIFSQLQELKIDKVGRIQISTSLIKKYNLSQDIIVIGVDDHLEIFNIATWEEYKNCALNNFDETAEGIENE